MGDDNVSKIIMLLGGIVLTLIVVMIGYRYYNQSKSSLDTVENDVAVFQTTLDESKYTQYEGQTVLGNQVISYVSQYANTEIAIEVVSKNGTTTFYNYSDQDMSTEIDQTTNSQNIANAKSKSSTQYINPNGKFECTLYRDATNTIKCVIFTQQ